MWEKNGLILAMVFVFQISRLGNEDPYIERATATSKSICAHVHLTEKK